VRVWDARRIGCDGGGDRAPKPTKGRPSSSTRVAAPASESREFNSNNNNNNNNMNNNITNTANNSSIKKKKTLTIQNNPCLLASFNQYTSVLEKFKAISTEIETFKDNVSSKKLDYLR
jgi:hypothetical protein